MGNNEISTIRKEITDWVSELDDENMLALLNSIKLSQASSNDWWNEITESDKLKINQGLSDLKSGRTVSSEQFWDELQRK